MVRGDMTDSMDIQRALVATISLFGGIDAVVANVGSGSARGRWQLTSDDWCSVLNTKGGMLLSTAAFPHLISGGGGKFYLDVLNFWV